MSTLGGSYSLNGTASFARELDLTLTGQDSRQYVVTGSGGVLFAWTLPESDARGEQTAKAGSR